MFPRNSPPPDAGGLYRLLHGLERDGSLRSSWTENPEGGPARRVYELTDSGRHTLDGWAYSIACEIQTMSRLLTAYHRGTAGHEPPDGTDSDGLTD
jgi:PadR family transcriptional regulator PadR